MGSLSFFLCDRMWRCFYQQTGGHVQGHGTVQRCHGTVQAGTFSFCLYTKFSTFIGAIPWIKPKLNKTAFQQALVILIVSTYCSAYITEFIYCIQ